MPYRVHGLDQPAGEVRGTPANLLTPHPALSDPHRRCAVRPVWQRTLDDYERRLNLAPRQARLPLPE